MSRSPRDAIGLRAQNLLREVGPFLEEMAKAEKKAELRNGRNRVAVALQFVLEAAGRSGLANNLQMVEAIAQAHVWFLREAVPDSLRNRLIASHHEMLRRELQADEQLEATTAEFLRGLAERLMSVPVMYGTDQGDVDRLNAIAAGEDDPS